MLGGPNASLIQATTRDDLRSSPVLASPGLGDRARRSRSRQILGEHSESSHPLETRLIPRARFPDRGDLSQETDIKRLRFGVP